MGSRGPRVLVSLAVGVAVLAGLVGARAGADAADEPRAANRALIIVDDGVTRREQCVLFHGELSGLEALELAGADATLSGYGGLGSAVCAIDGHGCPAASCLTCAAPDYWQYFRADASGDRFTPSAAGASTTDLDDGDVELWLWGSHSDPGPVPDIDDRCPRAPATTRPAPVTTATPPTTRPRPPGGSAPPTAVLPPVSEEVPTTTIPGATTTARPTTTARAPDDDQETAGAASPSTGGDDPGEGAGRGETASPPTDRGAGGGGADTAPTAGVAAAAVVIGGAVGAATILRRRGSA